MAYMHDWNCDVAEFSEELLEDVKIVLVHHADILRDISVSNTYITFNGRREKGYETFCFETNRSGWCKTNMNDYDEAVTTVLLLAHYYYGENVRISSSGNHSFYIHTETKAVGGYFEESLTYIEETFGYRFEKEVKQDEYGQQYIDFNPLPSKKKETKSLEEIVSKELGGSHEAIALLLNMLQKNSFQEESSKDSLQLLYNLMGVHTQCIQNYMEIVDNQMDDEKQEEIHTHEIVLERITELYQKMEDCMKKLEYVQSEREKRLLRNTIAMDAEVIGMYLQLVEEE